MDFVNFWHVPELPRCIHLFIGREVLAMLMKWLMAGTGSSKWQTARMERFCSNTTTVALSGESATVPHVADLTLRTQRTWTPAITHAGKAQKGNQIPAETARVTKESACCSCREVSLPIYQMSVRLWQHLKCPASPLRPALPDSRAGEHKFYLQLHTSSPPSR